jgi:hypothetical protein
MAINPVAFYKVNDRRSSSGYQCAGPPDRLYAAAVQNDQRQYVHDLNRDVHRNISAYGRRTLSTLGKRLYANSPVIRGAINEMAYYSVGTWVPQYYGRNKAWGTQAEDVLFEHDKICNRTGGSMLDYLTNLIRAVYICGDIATVYTQRPSGYPVLQVIPGHRIHSGDDQDGVVKSGPFDGATIVDGVIVDDVGEPIGYRIFFGDTSEGYQDLQEQDVKLHFIQEWENQLRGASQLASVVFPFQDIKESDDADLLYKKLASFVGLIEHNEDGEADAAKKILEAPSSSAFNADSSKAYSYTEVNQGITNRYFRAGAGNKLEEFRSDRPGANGQEFKRQIMREALQGIGWSYDFTLDPTKVGGVTGRIVVEKINKTISFIQQTLVKPASARFNGYRIRKLIKGGYLPDDVDWWKFDYQGPAKLTADEKYSSDVALQEFRAGIKPPQQIIAERGNYWEDVLDQKIEWERQLQERSKAAGVDPNRIMLLTPNGNPPDANDQNQPTPQQ